MGWRFLAVAALALAAPAAIAPLAASQQQAQAEEIVVIAQRSGVPIWKVRSDRTTLVLVGAIRGVPKDARWDPNALVEAMRRADRVMFPQMQSFSASVFAYPGLLLRWRRQASLPKGGDLSTFLPPEQLDRLETLQRRRLIDRNYVRSHPLHLGLGLRRKMFAEGRDAYEEARRAISKHKLKVVPIAEGKLKPVANQLFASSPRSHVPCLLSAVELAEAGTDVVRARARAWLARRPRLAIDNAAERAQQNCWPSDPAGIAVRDANHTAVLRRLLAEPQVTLAVMDLSSLARDGGILDALEQASYEIEGPDWRH